MKPKIFLIGTGGTISCSKNSGKPVYSTQALLNLFPEIAQHWDITCEDLFSIDSSHIMPKHWVEIAEKVFSALDKFDGIVILHGTDTMNYTAAALSFMLQNLSKPIVLTGAQVAPDEIISDARNNLLSALRVASDADLGEVVIVFAGRIIRGNRARKFREKEFDAFVSVGYPELGNMEADIRLNSLRIKRKAKRKPLIFSHINPNVTLIKLYPGYSPTDLDEACKRHSGVIIEAFGAGNISENLVSVIRTHSSRIPIIISTQCADGASWMHLYEAGRKGIEAGAYPSYDLISETALVKLMWLLGREISDPCVLREKFLHSYAGEISREIKTNKMKPFY